MHIIIIIIIIIIIQYGCLLSQALSSWYFSRTSGDPHRSGFKFHTAVLSVLRVMFLVQLSFVAKPLNVFLVWLPHFFLKHLVDISVAPVIAGIIIHFIFHISCIFVHKLLHLSLFSAFFCMTFLPALLLSLSLLLLLLSYTHQILFG